MSPGRKAAEHGCARRYLSNKILSSAKAVLHCQGTPIDGFRGPDFAIGTVVLLNSLISAQAFLAVLPSVE